MFFSMYEEVKGPDLQANSAGVQAIVYGCKQTDCKCKQTNRQCKQISNQTRFQQNYAMTVAVCKDNEKIDEDIQLFGQALSDDDELIGERLRTLSRMLKDMGY